MVAAARISGYLMTAAGLFGIVVGVLGDALGIGRPGFGLDQLAALVLGAFFLLAGRARLLGAGRRALGRILACAYGAGVLFMGLAPRGGKTHAIELFWDARTFFSRDFFINSVGFILVGYLLMLSLGSSERQSGPSAWAKRAGRVVLIGAGLSFFLELSQYLLIPGRTPSTADLAANVLGTVSGVLLYGFDAPAGRGKQAK